MADKTDRFGLQVLDAGDNLSEDGYAFVKADRYLIDRLLELGAETHVHTGESAAESTVDPPQLTLDTNGGAIPAGRRIRYKLSLVNGSGLETAGSLEAFIDTPNPVDAPAAPSLLHAPTGGTHFPGTYYYALTAYQDNITSETKALNTSHILVSSATTTNKITLDLPSLPSGATGFNVYRRRPGGTKYIYLDSVDLSLPSPPTEYVDDNSVVEDCDRTVPSTNSTFSTNSVSVTFSGATPMIPEGYTWRIYRTFISDNYNNSLLAWVVEETAEGSGIITPTFDDIGEGTTTGSPPLVDQATGSPSKIQLTHAAEVQGYLPPGRNVVPHVVYFTKAGPLETPEELEQVWVCEFDRAQIISCRAYLGRDSAPAATDVIVDVNLFTEDVPSWETIYATQMFRPTVPVGLSVGSSAYPDTVALVAGNLLSVDIDQVGAGATPTDNDLTVAVYMMIQSGDVDSTWTWS